MGTCVRQSKDAFINVNVDKSKQGAHSFVSRTPWTCQGP